MRISDWSSDVCSSDLCMTMGTASTMGAIAETLGLTLPGASSIPAADSGHARMASQTGRRIVEMVWDDLKPSDILSAASFDNAVALAMAVRSEEHTSEIQSLMRISYAVFCLTKKKKLKNKE